MAKSFEVIKEVVDSVGVKQAAHDVGVSSALMYKWCEDADEAAGSSGTRNPLDRLKALCEHTKSTLPAEWLCNEIQGFFVANPEDDVQEVDIKYIEHTQRLLAEFSDLLQTISTSIRDDDVIDQEEAAVIRDKWQMVKQHGEAFVVGCEQGLFNDEAKGKKGKLK